jgi:3-hydroxyisobutyrate dehydrogenase-like beta-hydroxyacid dehydrogenase
MSKIAFLGLGHMGIPMAARLANAGHDVTVWDRSPDHLASFAAPGATTAASPAAAAAGIDFAITMLATPEALNNVLFGPDGLAATLSAGQTWVDMSTVGPDAFRSAAGQLDWGVVAVDAPVRGSIPEAAGGRLYVYVGAGKDEFERVRPVLQVFGDVCHVGPPGAGAAMKLVVNTTLTASIVALGEALALGRALGLDQSSMLDVLADSPVGPTVRAKRANVESGHYPGNFALWLAAKDMRLASEAADHVGVDLQTARSVRRWLEQAADEGAADLDFSAVVATILDQPAQP